MKVVLSDTGVALGFDETPSNGRDVDSLKFKNLVATDLYPPRRTDRRHGEAQAQSFDELPLRESINSNVVTMESHITRNFQREKEKNQIRFPTRWPFEWKDSEIPKLIGKSLSVKYASILGLEDYDYDFELVFVAEDDQRENKYKAVFCLDVPAIDKHDFPRIWNEAVAIYESVIENLKRKSKPGSRQRKDLLDFYKIARVHLER